MNEIVSDPPEPFWFVSSELLEGLFRVELALVSGSVGQQPELRRLFDTPATTASQRKTCFSVLAHLKVLEMISEMFAGRYQQPSLSGEESKALSTTGDLVTIDAPEWALEMHRIAEALPFHLFNALPESLRTTGFNQNNAPQLEAIRSFDTVEQLQTLIESVFDQQLRRLEERWSASSWSAPSPVVSGQRLPAHTKKPRRRRDKQRADRDRLIEEIDEVTKTVTEFLQMMDARKVEPQPTWQQWPGSWIQAYKDPHLRELIHKDKNRALARARSNK